MELITAGKSAKNKMERKKINERTRLSISCGLTHRKEGKNEDGALTCDVESN